MVYLLAATLITTLFSFVSVELKKTTAQIEDQSYHGEGRFKMKNVKRMAETPMVMLDVLTYAEIKIGSKVYRLLVDSGSSTLAILGKKCAQCEFRFSGQWYMELSPSNVLSCADPRCSGHYGVNTCDSQSPKTEACPFRVAYADQTSESGYITSDIVSVGQLLVETHFGVITKATPVDSFASMSVDGILGVGTRAINFGNPPFATLPEEIYLKYSLPSILSMAVGVQNSDNSGVLHIGGYDPERYTSIEWTPMTSTSGWYVVSPTHMSIGNVQVTNSPSDFGKTIIDSGTTFTFVPPKIYDTIKKVLQNNYPHLPGVTSSFSGNDIFNSGQCFAMDISKYPILYFTFEGGVTVAVPPKGYFSPAHAGGVEYQCFGFASSGVSSQFTISSTQTILGDTFMSSFYIVLDSDSNRMGLGILPANAHILIPPAGSDVSPDFTASSYLGITQTSAMLILFAFIPLVVCWQFRQMNPDSDPQSILIASGLPVAATKYGTM
eukprot:TRINITY_DN2080_c2_g2_i1.p1 TRINITY_DN2080_c2_g2~~TRINITY_DN2080_c2_g2_i1.p1  ORF type:complete len:494 (+),score=54.17 TRINITY_DN2080_c2_g2_i1:44-1525(+)